MTWYTLHQPASLFLDGTLINFVYPVLPWIGLMAFGYAFGAFYSKDFAAERRKPWLWWMGIGVTLLFVLLRGLNLYVIHALAMLFLVTQGREAGEYILSAGAIRSGRLSNFGLSLDAVYLVWIAVVVMLYPLCSWYQKIREEHPSAWWLRYL